MEPITHASLREKKQRLESIKAELKNEFFGIDTAIDSIISSIQTWYLLPQAITRPVVTNLWGLTGVGKTALVRSLVDKLGFQNRFVEIQMDTSSVASYTSANSICGILESSPIEEGQQGIVLLDEFQRFRTVDGTGKDIKLERYQDVWMLLSDGRFSSDYSFISRLEEQLADDEYNQDARLMEAARKKANDEAKAAREAEIIKNGGVIEKKENNTKKYSGASLDSLFGVEAGKEYIRAGDNDEDDKEEENPDKVTVAYKRRFKLSPWEARSFKKLLRLSNSITEIMTWDHIKIKDLSREYISKNKNQSIDYTKSLIFVCGNLDEAFKMAESVEDCDTNADVFCEYSKRVGVTNIKSALTTRFRPEQIARLGNNHVIYPSLNRAAYEKIIRVTCARYLEEIEKACGIGFVIDEDVYREIYDNAVYPTQGTRPVFTSIHKLFGSPLSDGVLFAFETGTTLLKVTLDVASSSLVFTHTEEKKKAIHIDLDIRTRKARYSEDFVALVAIHEAGHAIAFASLFKCPPREIAISVASFEGGYNLYDRKTESKIDLLHSISVCMAGIAAEEMIFGEGLRSCGCVQDVLSATKIASSYVRHYAFDGFSTFIQHSPNNGLNEDIDSTNPIIDNLVKERALSVSETLTSHRDLVLSLARHLVKVKKMDDKAFVSFIGDKIEGLKSSDVNDIRGNYKERMDSA